MHTRILVVNLSKIMNLDKKELKTEYKSIFYTKVHPCYDIFNHNVIYNPLQITI